MRSVEVLGEFIYAVLWCVLLGGIVLTGALFLALPEWLLLAMLLVAAFIDAHSRRFPNALFAVMLPVAASCALYPALFRLIDWFHWGLTPPDPIWGDLARSAAVAVPCAALLAAVEVAWRRWRGSPGLGMGDVKLLLVLMLASPLRGAISFAGGLILLSIGCLISRRRSLPLIPFVAPVWAVCLVARVAWLMTSGSWRYLVIGHV